LYVSRDFWGHLAQRGLPTGLVFSGFLPAEYPVRSEHV
jgi:hypothetical protein